MLRAMKNLILFPTKITWFFLALVVTFVTQPIVACAGIEQLLVGKVAIPTLRPDFTATGSIRRPPSPPQSLNIKQLAQQPANAGKTARAAAPSIIASRGSLKQGLEAISKKDMQTALSIRKGMPGGSLNRKILAWAIALSGQAGVSSSQIANISSDLANWPGQSAMRRNSEKALAREGLSASAIVQAFGNQTPASLTGAVLLTKAYLALGKRKAAQRIIAPHWHFDKLSKKKETEILKSVGKALSANDHRIRMHYLFYRGRSTAANRMASLAGQVSLARARSAVNKRLGDAGKKLNAVAASSRRDPGYLFAKIQYLRRAEKYKQAARLMASAPRDPNVLVHPDEWWVERRIISRALLDLGEYRLAYKLAAEHSARSKTKRAEAEFHAGWYALRFLKNRRLARKHFSKILKISKTPISQARAYYWLARASAGGKARKLFKSASQYQGTYYGQLALVKLGKRRLSVRAKKPGISQRSRFKSRELVKAITKLEANNYGWRADIIYRHLAKTLTDAGEIALLSARAEKIGKRNLALQIGKIAYRRGLPTITSSWPIGAIPTSARIGKTGRALAYSIARQESGFNHKAVSGANARGLLQLLPGTAKLMAKKTGVAYSYKKLTRDPAYNATLGAAYLSQQLQNFNGSYILTFAGYNAGPGRAKKWIAKYGDPRGQPLNNVIDWVERIPFTETRNYVQRVMENMQVYKARIAHSRLEIDRDLVRGRR